MTFEFPWVAYRGSSLVCHSVTYLAYWTACRVVYAGFLACIDDICVLAMEIIISIERTQRSIQV